MAEITDAGFERESYTTLLEDIKGRFRDAFGKEVALTDSDPLGQFAALLAKLQNDNNNLAEALWASRKLEGAEGIYLDDIFGRLGVYRRGKQRGTGTVLIETDATTANSFLFPTTTTINANNGQQYNAQADTLLVSSVSAYKLDKADIVTAQQYDFTLVDTTDGLTYPFTYTPSDDADKDLMLESLKSFWLSHTTNNEELITVSNSVLYIGYDETSLSLEGISEVTEFTSSPVIGSRHSQVAVIAAEAGYYPLEADEVVGIDPEFTGFLSITNPLAFYAGSEVETDAAYRVRAFQELKTTKAGTRDSIVAAVLGVEGVTKVRIYDNPTTIDTAEADARSFNTVVLGGTLANITKAIYDTKPIAVGTSGTSSAIVATADGTTETVRYTPAEQVSLSVRVKYATDGNTPLSDFEKTSISTSLTDTFANLRIGQKLFNTNLVFSVLSAEGASRLISATLETKLTSEATTLFITSDRTPDFDQLYTLTENDITFSQQLS